jgi:nucleoid DNA-binding protein
MAIRNLLQDSMVDGMDADNELTGLIPVSQKPTVDTSVIDNLTKQILAQNTSDKWQGGVNAQTAAKDMAKIMAGIGITDIRQFGIIEAPASVEVKQDGKGGYIDEQGKPVDPSLVTNQSYSMEGGDVSYFTAPIGKSQNFGNKVTGQLVPNTYGERQGGNAFGGTYEGKGNTGYRVDFTPDGTPIFYTTGASSSDVQDWMPLLQLGLAVTGAGGLLGNALLGSGASQVASNVLGNAILGGTTTGIAGGNILKGALTAGAAAGIAPATEMVLGKIPDFNALSNPVKAAVTNAVSGTIMNKGEITPAVLVSALTAGLGAAGKDAELKKFESEMTESGLAGQTSITDEDLKSLGLTSNVTPTSGTQATTPSVTSSSDLVSILAQEADNFGANSLESTIPSWVVTASDEVVTGSRVDSQGQTRYEISRINPADPKNPLVYEAILDPETNQVTYEWGGEIVDAEGNLVPDVTTTSSGSKPSWTYDPYAQNTVIAGQATSPTANQITLDDVTRVLSGQNYARPEDIQAAINSINIPQGITNQDVQSIVSTALANNPSLTTDQVSQIVNNAVSNIPSGLTAADVTKIIGGQNFATPEDIQTAINSINIPQGLSEQDVKTIVSNAFASNPSLTSTQVSQIVNSAISQIPSGLTASDVQSIVGTAVSKLPAAPTTQDIINIIGGQGLASTAQLTQQGQDLMAALRAQGVDYNTALNQAIQAQSTGFTTSINDVIKQIGGVQTGLESQLGGVQTNLESQLTAQGKALMDSLQQQGLDYQTALNEALTSQASQFQNQITGVQTGLESQLDAQGRQFLEALQERGVDYKTALDEAIAQQTAKYETSLGEVKTGFEEQLAKSTASTSADLAKLMSTLGLVGSTISAIQAANTPKTYTYNLADPSTWGSPVYNQTPNPITPMTPLDFGNREMLRGTQWEKFLDPNYGKVPAPAQFNQPSNMSYDRLMSVLGTGQDVLPSQALSINDVISGIQNQYGQTPTGSMG